MKPPRLHELVIHATEAPAAPRHRTTPETFPYGSGTGIMDGREVVWINLPKTFTEPNDINGIADIRMWISKGPSFRGGEAEPGIHLMFENGFRILPAAIPE